MSLATFKYCDRCKKRIHKGRGATVLKSTDRMTYPELHLCEGCFRECFARYLRERAEKEST